MGSVVVTDTLDWKLHGLDLLSEHQWSGDLPLTSATWMVASQYKPAEVAKGDWQSLKVCVHTVCLCECFWLCMLRVYLFCMHVVLKCSHTRHWSCWLHHQCTSKTACPLNTRCHRHRTIHHGRLTLGAWDVSWQRPFTESRSPGPRTCATLRQFRPPSCSTTSAYWRVSLHGDSTRSSSLRARSSRPSWYVCVQSRSGVMELRVDCVLTMWSAALTMHNPV